MLMMNSLLTNVVDFRFRLEAGEVSRSKLMEVLTIWKLKMALMLPMKTSLVCCFVVVYVVVADRDAVEDFVDVDVLVVDC